MPYFLNSKMQPPLHFNKFGTGVHLQPIELRFCACSWEHHRAVVVMACPCVNIIRPIHTALTSAELCALLELHVLISISNVFNTTLWFRIAIMYAKGDKNRTAGHFWCYWSEHVRYQRDNHHSIFYCKATLTCLIGPQQGKCNCIVFGYGNNGRRISCH